MASKYWIKLYHEILHDRKMATLDNRIWRRAIECFLFAGDLDEEGYLPRLADMAWVLHLTEEELETDLNELVRLGILEHRDGLYFVRKFAERQAPLPKAEYMRRKRNEDQLQTYYQPRYQSVTNGNADKIRIDKIRKEETASAASSFHDHQKASAERLYQQVTSQVTIPSGQIDGALQDLETILDYYGEIDEGVIQQGKQIFSNWCNTRGKNGKNYSKTNTAWLGWWLEALAPQPGVSRTKDQLDMNEAEFKEYSRMLQERGEL